MNTSKAFASLTLLITFSFISADAQNRTEIDGLWLKYHTADHDSVRAKTLYNLSQRYVLINSDSALLLAGACRDLSRKIGYARGIFYYHHAAAYTLSKMLKYEEAHQHADEAIQLALLSKNNQDLAYAYHEKSTNFDRQKNLPKLLEYAQKAKEAAKNVKNDGLMASIEYNISRCYYLQGEFEQFLEHSLAALRLNENDNYPSVALNCLFNISDRYFRYKDYEKGLEYAQRMAELAKRKNMPVFEARAMRLIGDYYFKIGQNATADDYFLRAYKMVADFPGASTEMGSMCNAVGLVYLNSNQSRKAIQFFEQSEKIFSVARDTHMLAILASNRGWSYHFLEMQDSARLLHERSVEWIKKTSRTDVLISLLEQLTEFYSRTKNFEQAFKTHLEFKRLSDSITNSVNLRKSLEREAALKFETEKEQQQKLLALAEKDKLASDYLFSLKNRELLASQLEAEKQAANVFALQTSDREKTLENAALDAENRRTAAENKAKTAEIALQNLQISRERWGRWAIIALALAVLGGLFRLFQKRRRQDVLALRTDLARDLHDDLGSEISSLGLSAFTAARSGDARKMSTVLEQVSAQSSRLVEDMRDLVWTMNPENDNLEKMLARVRQNALRLLDGQEVSLKFNIEPALAALRLAPEVQRQLFLMFKESLNNLAKYARCSAAQVRVYREKDAVFFEVRDDGVGFDPAAVDGGNGLRNLKTRAAALGGVAEIESEPGRGTVVRWRTPLG